MLKKCQIVMLPINEKAENCLVMEYNGDLYFTKQLLTESYRKEARIATYHLYILSDEEIKEGDWYLLVPEDQVKQAKINIAPHRDFKKIIATTDSSLLLENEEVIARAAGFKSSITIWDTLPQPSQSFLEVFVREYNKGNVIKEVMVEYKEEDWTGEGEIDRSYYKTKLKVNPKDNTITIKRVKESWNREEVEKLVKEAFEGGYCSALNNSKAIKGITSKEWIEQNL